MHIILPEEIKCPNCGVLLELDSKERKEKRFNCPACNKSFDMNSENSTGNLVASTGQRLSTYILDLIFYYILSFVSIYILASIGLGQFIYNMNEYLLIILFYFIYYIPQETISGKTLGKIIAGTKAINEDGTDLTFQTALGRTLCRFIPFEVFSFLGGNGNPIGWHDRIPKTIVISTKSSKRVKATKNDEIPLMDLDSYQGIYRDYLKPSDEQIKDFVDFVCHSKSWYKHLPLLPPGVPFHFYFDQFAGWKRIKKFGGKVNIVEREEDEQPLHYSYIPTKQYRERFGSLAYSCDVGTRMYEFSFKGIQDSNQLYPFVYTSDFQRFQIPEEVFKAGCIHLTAPIHSFIAYDCLQWISHPEDDLRVLYEGEWPEESGGMEVLNKIKQMSKLFHEKLSKRDKFGLGFKLPMAKKMEKLIAPEQNRLKITTPA